MNAIHDALELDLDGIRVVEASAGTGKTFTIATLYLRLILEHDLKVDEVVVATFTRAAAAELSERLRKRLVIADQLLVAEDPTTPQDDDDGEVRETRRVIARALALGIERDTLRQRASHARLDIDTAFINTLHGFCHRALAEFGFDAGQPLRQPELIDDIRALELEVVRDFWRRGSANATTACLLAGIWKSPDALARQVADPRWRGRTIAVANPDFNSMLGACEAARERIAAWDESALQIATDALHACIEYPPTLKQRRALLRELYAWAHADSPDDEALATAAKQAESLCAKSLDNVKPKGVHAHGPTFDDLETLRAAHENLLQARESEQKLPAAHLLREARSFLESELPKRLAEHNLLGHDQAVDRLVAALEDPARGQRLINQVRARWKAALIDEFQDTDSSQWIVVEKLFGATRLVLVGDPKQAIYGFRGGDVFAWLKANDEARHRGGGHAASLRLTQSYRSGTGMCRAINALFSVPGAFIERGIEHPDIEAAKPERALLRDGTPEKALQLWWLDPETIGHAANRLPSKDGTRRAIESACVAWIADALNDARAKLRDADGNQEALKPRHIAVLVNSNPEALAMQAALGRAGIPAASNLRASVFASDEAADLALLLDAIAAPDDASRARAARASVLVGDNAAAIAASLHDDAQQAALLEDAAAWAAAVRRHGPLPWLRGLLETAAPRLLTLPDGQRRIANYLQLAELLQAMHAQSFGLADLAVRFARARLEAAQDDDAARLRLDTDADAVTVSTVHAAKGLEYDVVLVPYAALGTNPEGKHDARPALRWYHEGNTDPGGSAARVSIGASNDDVSRRAASEICAEDVRKFYVAITRASALCVLPYGPTSCTQYSAACHLLQQTGREAALPVDAAGCMQALRDLCERAGGAAEIVPLPQATSHSHATHATDDIDLQARPFTRTNVQRDWQTWSFSRLVRGSGPHIAANPAPGAGDADALHASTTTAHDELAGARFGTAVHTVFERTEFAVWRSVADVPASERALIETCLHEQGLAQGAAATQRAVGIVGDCVRSALNATLPCAVRLCDIATHERKAEIEFHLALAPARSAELYALLHRHGYQQQRSGVTPTTLHGLLTGKIDLTFQHAGRFHIVDWKTNRCPPYDDAALRAEIALHDYDLQWLVYTLALHRWLGQQLPDYNYDRHVGEAYYLFVRGMGDGHGVHADRPPRELIEAMDALFDTAAREAA